MSNRRALKFIITDFEYDMFHRVGVVAFPDAELADRMWGTLPKVPDSCVAVEYLGEDGEELGDGFVTESVLEHVLGVPYSKLLNDARKRELRRIRRAQQKRQKLGTNPITIATLQKEAFATATEKGWHEEDEQPPSEAVRRTARESAELLLIAEHIEQHRRGLSVDRDATTPLYDRLRAHLTDDPESDHFESLSARQVRVIAWLGLMATEVAEAIEDVLEDRWDLTTDEHGRLRGLPSELADIFIRGGDTAGFLGIDLTAAILAKMAYNRTRSRQHGGKKL